MALRYGFFNSINGDRKYDALDMSSIFDGIIEDGVFATIGKIFAVTPGEGLQVIVDTGKAWFNHTWTSNDAKIPMDIDAADITLDRYDAVVLEVNNTESIRANSIKIIKGTAASDPQKPDMVSTDLIHQYPLAYVRVVHGATEIQNMYIELTVGKEPCPFVRGPLETVPIDALFAQWESEFDYWFANVKTNLEGDVAANLQKQIDENKDQIQENWDNTLSSATKELLKMKENSVPDDAFVNLYNRISLIMGDQASITITLQASDGTKLSGIPIQGLSNIDGGTAISNEYGVASGVVPAGKQVTLSTSNYFDLADKSEKYTPVKGESYSYTWTLTYREQVQVDTTSRKRFSILTKEYDACAIGAGGGGAGSYNYRRIFPPTGGGGGGGGYIQNALKQIPTPNYDYIVTIGAGGNGGPGSDTNLSNTGYCLGKDGGRTKLSKDDTDIVVANGGKGGGTSQNRSDSPGLGNGNGGTGANQGTSSTPTGGTNGLSASTYLFGESELGVPGGGGGGGGRYQETTSTSQTTGGTPKGGKGGLMHVYEEIALPENGKSPGGGGGGGGIGGRSNDSDGSPRNQSGAKGGNGALIIRMRRAAS